MEMKAMIESDDGHYQRLPSGPTVSYINSFLILVSLVISKLIPDGY